MVKRGLNKKGQEAVTGFGVTGIVLIVFMVVVILGIWYVNGVWEDATSITPKKAEAIALACSNTANEIAANTYCFELREIRKNEYITCDKAEDYGILVLGSDESDTSIKKMNVFCGEKFSFLNTTVLKECNDPAGKFYEKKSKVKINGKTCLEWINGSVGEDSSDVGGEDSF